MKIAIVDDETACLKEMEPLLKSFGEAAGYPVHTAAFHSAEAFLEVFDDTFDLVFMDVCMKGMSGIAAAFQMRSKNSGCILVFLTASTEFMPDAFSCHAFEYITKPVSEERIFHVLSDALKVLPQKQKYMELTVGRRILRVFLDEIASAVTDAHYLDITLADQTGLRCRMTLSDFLEKTAHDARFIPINKGIAVNAEYILEFEKGCCIMENGMRFPVRVRDSAKVEQMARDYLFETIRRRPTNFSGRLGMPDLSKRFEKENSTWT